MDLVIYAIVGLVIGFALAFVASKAMAKKQNDRRK